MVHKNISSDLVKTYRTTRYARQVTDETIRSFLSSLDCPRSLACWMLYESKEHIQLLDLECDPHHYNSSGEFRDAFSATKFLSKSDFLDTGIDKDAVAIKKWLEFESLCDSTNQRFRNLSADPLYTGQNVSLLSKMIRKIQEILTPFSAEEFASGAGWGPGVSNQVKGQGTSGYNKFRAERGITRELAAFVTPWFSTAYPSWMDYATDGEIRNLDSFFNLEVGNTVITVPKNSKTNRVIAVEPGFNTWFQKAIGRMIRSRLVSKGIHLKKQWSKNAKLSELGSIRTGLDGLATIDFSSASDSISKDLVRCLISDQRWLSLMEACRSRYGIRDGKSFKWKKFSAMGNGFTFELESLIFFCAATAVCEELSIPDSEVSIYGDDVILPLGAVSLYEEFTHFLGFRINKSKSYSSSYFRESCGEYYFDGLNCKPIYLKGKLTNVESVYQLANSVRTYAHRRLNFDGCDSKLRSCWTDLLRRVPKALRFGIPSFKGDGGLIMNFDEAVPRTAQSGNQFTPRAARNGFEGYRYTAFLNLGVTRWVHDHGLLLARLAGIKGECVFERNEYTLRGVVRSTISRDLLCAQWPNLGSWKTSSTTSLSPILKNGRYLDRIISVEWN